MAHFSIRFLSEAAGELEEANEWYEAREPRAAQQWRDAFAETLSSIRQTPKLWAADQYGFRHVLVRPFSYTIVYLLHADTIVLVAVAHTSRKPGYWRKRLKKLD